MLITIQRCFKENKVLYTMHAREEMKQEEYGTIIEKEVYQAVLNGKIIEMYENAQPYPSALLYGMTSKARPIHTVCAYCKEDDLVIIVTVYQPSPERWVNHKRRKK